MKEFDWLGYCVSCNTACCHNEDKSIPENECSRIELNDLIVKRSKLYYPVYTQAHSSEMNDLPDYRPLECRLFPFDITEIDEKLMWLVWSNCPATPKLDYEKALGFMERKFSRRLPLEHIIQYITDQKLNESGKMTSDGFKIIREVNWQIGNEQNQNINEY